MITMVTDSGESVDFYVLEETRINARSYLLVTDAPEGEAVSYTHLFKAILPGP